MRFKNAKFSNPIFVLLCLVTIPARAQSSVKSFDQAFADLQKSPEYQATSHDIQSMELDYQSREIVLEPVLEVAGSRLNDRRQLLSTSATPKTTIDSFDIKLTKPFSTGTDVSISPSYESALSPTLTPDRRDTLDWQISVSQSLWQDGFGRSTRLRRSRENYEHRRDLAIHLAKRGQLLVDFESLYWDWALAQREVELQVKNMKRSQEILRWVENRFRRSAAEATDLLQAKALLTQRQLQVASLKQTIEQSLTKMNRYVPGASWSPAPEDLSKVRAFEQMCIDWKPDDLGGKPTTLDFLQAQNESLAAEIRAREVSESFTPELNLELAYGKNAIDPNTSDALRRSYESDHEYSSIGLVFRTGLDFGSQSKSIESARASQNAAVQRESARKTENALAWTQLKKDLADLSDRIEKTRALVSLQDQKANAERERYRKGRSTAFQAITFEQDAAESEITLWQLYALMRKTEARARLFAR
jgi:outer membrane protein TolC